MSYCPCVLSHIEAQWKSCVHNFSSCPYHKFAQENVFLKFECNILLDDCGNMQKTHLLENSHFKIKISKITIITNKKCRHLYC